MNVEVTREGVDSSGGGRTERTDPETGVREVIEFFGPGPDRLLGLRYTPTRVEAHAGVVICEPLLSQFIAHYRYGTLMARRLASAGLVVQRFHYRSTGNSDGDIRDLTLDRMHEDTSMATELLRERSGIGEVGFLGVQIGAYVAARASRPGSPVVLDSPPRTGREYLKNAFRSHAVVMMQSGIEATPRDVLLRQMEDDGVVTLLGARLSDSLYRSLQDRSILDEMGDRRRPVLLIGGSQSGQLKPVVEGLRQDLVTAGFDVETVARRKEDPFWYVDHAAPEDHTESAELADEIGEWLRSQFSVAVGGSDG